MDKKPRRTPRRSLNISKTMFNLGMDRCGDLPDEFDHLIEFNPTPPEPPHTVNDHVEMSKYSEYLQIIAARERK